MAAPHTAGERAEGARARSRRERVTISDIAREAGVSVPTVSKVLNGHAHVAAGTRRKVERLLAKYQYTRRTKRREGQARLVDLVFNNLDSEWSVEIIRGVEAVAHESGLGTVVSAIHGETTEERRWLENLTARWSDGIILAVTELRPAHEEQIRALGIPMVIIDPVGQPDPQVASVGATNWNGALTATEHLISLGHERIGLIGGRPELQCSRARLDGYRSALRSAGLPVDDGLIAEGDFYAPRGEQAARELLSSPHPPTAIFAGNDQQALGVYRTAERLGMRVPDDLSVVGFDDLPAAGLASPPLTTIRQPVAQMAAQAMRMLLRCLETGSFETRRLELSTELVVRDSTAPPRRH
ncbi:LacI family DNA-binding transcriptional regulator [Streptomyces abyssalis]|uniref:LacI family DNA-binding transcriptional regulator n=1 Tax=Streptomyces abyssalis TaxID=933944 RepID=UPI00099F9673|nr:LacI family DNA-binding transcriptional regulator [Streptomyces abyssalis]